MHCCLLDRECWRDWWEWGAPMRLHWGRGRQRFVPVFPSWFMARWRWRDAEPVEAGIGDVLRAVLAGGERIGGPPYVHTFSNESEPDDDGNPVFKLVPTYTVEPRP